MSMSKIMISGGAVAGLGALGAVALASNEAPKPAAATAIHRVVDLPPEIRTVTVTRVIHRIRHEHAPARERPSRALVPAAVSVPAPSPAVLPRTATRAPAARTAPLRTSSSPSGTGGEHGGSDDHEHEGSHGDD